MTDAFFEAQSDGADWFTPSMHCRGPWHEDHCHAGPPTGLLARAMEQRLPEQQLTRITVALTRPIPFAGFRINTTIIRQGRTVSRVEAQLVSLDGQPVLSADGLFMTPSTTELELPIAIGSRHTESLMGKPEDATPGAFPIQTTLHGLPAFNGAGVETRYPDGENASPGRTRAWLKTVPLFEDETPSAFQAICPLADCGNAFGRLVDPQDVTFMNTDLTVLLHRAPEGQWLGTDSTCYWEPNGIGMSDSQLYDQHGPVGRALQTLLIRPNR